MADGSDEIKLGKEHVKETTSTGSGGNWVDDLQRTVVGSKESNHYLPRAGSSLKNYEDAFLTKLGDGLRTAKEHPAACLGVALASSLLLMRGPQRFLLRQTFGRFESEEARFRKAEKKVKDFVVSVDLMQKESKKLLERAALAENDVTHGYTELKDAGNEIQQSAKSTYKVELQATDLVDGLRAIPGREALKLRLEVASMASNLNKQRTELDRRILKISELGAG